MEKNTLPSALENLFVANEDFEELENALDVFCPFEAVGMVRQEIRHGHFLAYIFDPNRPHGFGTDCLRALLTAFSTSDYADEAGQANFITPLQVHLMPLGSAIVRREWERIDLLIEIPDEKMVICIELKVDAFEHSGQLGSYRRKVEQEWPTARGWKHFFLFLTTRGDEPSEDGVGWVPVPMETLVVQLEQFAKKQIGHEDARHMLRSYISMLRRHHLANEELEQIAARLWAQHSDALSYLMDQRPNPLKEIEEALFNRRHQIAAAISASVPFRIEVDDSSQSQLRFAVADWDDIPELKTGIWTSTGRLVLMEVERGRSEGVPIRIRFVIGRGPIEIRKKVYDLLRNEGAITSGDNKKFTDQFSRLSTHSVKTFADDGDRSADVVVTEIQNAVVAYAAKNIPTYDRALSKLRMSVA